MQIFFPDSSKVSLLVAQIYFASFEYLNLYLSVIKKYYYYVRVSVVTKKENSQEGE
jgi:hypothetical protein